MFFRRRGRGKQDPLPPNTALDPLFHDLAGNEMPESLDPKLDPKRTAVFDDEIDPAWRDPGTAG
jgi:hypothetical protein